MRFARLAPAALGLLAAGVLLSGCLAIKLLSLSQAGVGSPVTFQLTLCANDTGAPPNHPGCDIDTNSGDNATNGPVQLLLAVRVSAGATAPDTIEATAPEPGKPLSFTRSPSYEADLTKLLPPPAGEVWIGWVSNTYDYSKGADGAPARETDLEVSLGLPPGPGGAPFAGPFQFRWVVGGRRVVDPDLPASRPVDCGELPYGGDAPATSVCVDHPAPAVVEGPPGEAAVLDYGVTAGGPVTVDPGQAASLPFELSTTGAVGGGPTVALTATTALSGTSATPSMAGVPLTTDLRRPVTVDLTVPEAADAGTYDVTLAATLGDGTRRTATAQLVVNDTRDPVAGAVRVRPRRFRPSAPSLIAAAGARVSYSLSEAATVRFTVRRCRGRRCKRRVRGSFNHSGQAGQNAIRFSGFMRNRPLKRGRYVLIATPTDAAGNRGKRVRAKFGIRR